MLHLSSKTFLAHSKPTSEQVLFSFLQYSLISSSTSNPLMSELLLPSSSVPVSSDPELSEVVVSAVLSACVLPSSDVSSDVEFPVPAGTSGVGAGVVMFGPVGIALLYDFS